MGNLPEFFGQMVYRPPWQKIARTRMDRATLARPQQKCSVCQALGQCRRATERAAKKRAREKLRVSRAARYVCLTLRARERELDIRFDVNC